ncbi:hypothetical protein KCU66_g34, partial [Aureobasidium melanogenum]
MIPLRPVLRIITLSWWASSSRSCSVSSFFVVRKWSKTYVITIANLSSANLLLTLAASLRLLSPCLCILDAFRNNAMPIRQN